MDECFSFSHAALARRSRQPKFICPQKGSFGDEKDSVPKGMLVVGGFLCYKDSTRQRRVVEIP
ncbi:MAG: hypothetical protein Q8N83_08005 [Ignavibacteria bacterium]|nr:hypothetical protein [Ignavibacteria bacterium]